MTDEELIAWLRKIGKHNFGWIANPAADRMEALTAENKILRDAVYIDDLTVTMQANDRMRALAGIGKALDLLNADMVVEAKTALCAARAALGGVRHDR